MNVHVGDPVEILGEKNEAQARVTGIFLHHDNTSEPESLPYIDRKLFRTLVQDLSGVRVQLQLDTGDELSYRDLEESLAIDALDPGYEDGPEIER